MFAWPRKRLERHAPFYLSVEIDRFPVRGVSAQEEIVKRKLERAGWRVTHNGFPDFLCVRRTPPKRKRRRVVGAKWVEVKVGDDEQSAEQLRVTETLRALGFKVEVAYYPFHPEEETIIEYLRQVRKATMHGIWEARFAGTMSESSVRGRISRLMKVGTVRVAEAPRGRSGTLYELIPVPGTPVRGIKGLSLK